MKNIIYIKKKTHKHIGRGSQITIVNVTQFIPWVNKTVKCIYIIEIFLVFQFSVWIEHKIIMDGVGGGVNYKVFKNDVMILQLYKD